MVEKYKCFQILMLRRSKSNIETLAGFQCHDYLDLYKRQPTSRITLKTVKMNIQQKQFIFNKQVHSYYMSYLIVAFNGFDTPAGWRSDDLAVTVFNQTVWGLKIQVHINK